MTNDNMRRKAFLLSIALAITDSLLQDERPLTIQYDRLMSLNHKILKVTDMYRPEAWGDVEMTKAGEVFDQLNVLIEQAFS